MATAMATAYDDLEMEKGLEQQATERERGRLLERERLFDCIKGFKEKSHLLHSKTK